MTDNKRITDILKEYWDTKRQGRLFPSESDIDAEDLKEIWQNCFLAEVKDGKFNYDFFGSSIIEAYADDMEGEEVVEDLLYPENPQITNKFMEVLNAKVPVFYEGVFINKNNMDIKFRKILLPLGDNSKIKYILGGMRWKAF